MIERLKTYRFFLTQAVSIWPLVTFRMAFGLLMAFAGVRFWLNGWIDDLYITPEVYFSWFGLDFIKPLPGVGMYIVFAVMITMALMIALGLFYRVATVSYFILFTYVELIDKAPYLNHYYFVSIVALLLCLIPAHAEASLDVWRTKKRSSTLPRFMVLAPMLQLAIVYFFAGIAKIHPDWLFDAQPMKIWLPARANMPIIGSIFRYESTAYLFSWAGCLYDLTIPFFLIWGRTRNFAYIAVVVFHLMTWFLFQIGMFPWIMIFLTLIFFPAERHERFWKTFLPMEWQEARMFSLARKFKFSGAMVSLVMIVFTLHFVLQLILPLRAHWMSNDLFWDEAGFRFSWRVMLIEKAGSISFKVVDPATGRCSIVEPGDFLTRLQETQMSTQPDIILQCAEMIADRYCAQGIENPQVFADAFVTLNGSGSQRFVNPEIDLCSITHETPREQWLMPRQNFADVR